MKFWHFTLALTSFVLPALAWAGDNGLVNIPSKYSVPETLDKLESIVKEKGIRVFARIDFSGDAEKAGLKMRPSQMLIFGNPKAGTPLMVASPTIAIDLPLKALAWEDQNGKVWLSYNKPEYLKERHGLPDELVKNIAGIKGLVEKAAE
ncbi:MAG TPA: hypothetical protein DCP92_00140 [Nitrospiraceae bacterium]|nr:hypothetical protein [Nitrospiraceae bacterium]